MSSNYALVSAGIIVNVALVDDATDDGRAYLTAVAADYDDVVRVDAASPGQYIGPDGPIPRPSLAPDRPTIPPDGTTAAVVTYTNHEPTAPASVGFVVNDGTPATVALVDGSATLAVTSTTAGDSVTITAAGLAAHLEVTS